jgi:hypothetical protein
LTRSLREAAKSGSLKADEFAGRVGEIYDYIIDSKAAFLDAQQEVLALREKISAFNDDRQFRESLEFNVAGWYRRTGPRGEELYCSACLDLDSKRVRLTAGSYASNHCHIHGYREPAD